MAKSSAISGEAIHHDFKRFSYLFYQLTPMYHNPHTWILHPSLALPVAQFFPYLSASVPSQIDTNEMPYQSVMVQIDTNEMPYQSILSFLPGSCKVVFPSYQLRLGNHIEGISL